MEQAAARALAREHSTPDRIVVATTSDAFHGKWEKTHVWGVATVVDGVETFFSSPDFFRDVIPTTETE